MTAYYNEIDPYAAQWLRNLIAAGHIAAGDVDERSIVEVRADDLRGYTQCHFFAGIGVWSHALRLAGWPDDRPVWTGSCPCQPFSAAGKGEGTADARHLWPEWFRLIGECRPVRVFGEQVGAAIRHGWLDLVSADLEGADYAFGSAVVGAHSVGAPHIRQRLFFVADAEHAERGTLSGPKQDEYHGQDAGRTQAYGIPRARGSICELADAGVERRQQVGRGAPCDEEAHGRAGRDGVEPHGDYLAGGNGQAGELAHHQAGRRSEIDPLAGRGDERDGSQGSERPVGGDGASFWSACDWLPCIDGKARPVEPGTFPLAHGAPARVGRLRAYGNAIVAPLAEEFVRAYMECRP